MEVSVTRGRLNGTSPKCGTAWKHKQRNPWRLAWKREQAEASQKEVCPYMPIRLVRTDTYGHSSPASAVRQPFVAHPWAASGWLYLLQFRFQQKEKARREKHESVKSRSPTKEVCPYMPIRLARTDTYGHSSQASAVRTTFCGSLVSGKWLAVPIPVPLSTRNKRRKC